MPRQRKGIRPHIRMIFACEKCGAQPGEQCLMPSGRRMTEVHAARWRAFNATIGKPNVGCDTGVRPPRGDQ